MNLFTDMSKRKYADLNASQKSKEKLFELLEKKSMDQFKQKGNILNQDNWNQIKN